MNILVWQKSKDGQKNTNRPKSVLDQMLNRVARSELTRGDVDDFDAWYASRFANN